MQRENSLHADAVGNAADGEGLGDAGTLAGDDRALKLLNSLSVTLADVDADANGIANAELGRLLLDGIGGNDLTPKLYSDIHVHRTEDCPLQ